MNSIGIVIPCYNEEARFDREQFLDFVRDFPQIDFCLVNDGSTDRTREMLSELTRNFRNRITFIHIDRNIGKAEAIRQGILRGFRQRKRDYLGYFDGDFSAPLHQIIYLLTFCKDHLTHPLIAGSRVPRMGASIIRNPSRRFLERILNVFSRNCFGIAMFDTQCGLKLIQTEVAYKLFENLFVSRWFFDLELILRLKDLSEGRNLESEILEVPLTEWHEKGRRLKAKYLLRAPLDLFRMKSRYRGGDEISLPDEDFL